MLNVAPPSVMFVVAVAFRFVNEPFEITSPTSELFDAFPIVRDRLRFVPKSNLAPPLSSSFSRVFADVFAAA